MLLLFGGGTGNPTPPSPSLSTTPITNGFDITMNFPIPYTAPNFIIVIVSHTDEEGNTVVDQTKSWNEVEPPYSQDFYPPAHGGYTATALWTLPNGTVGIKEKDFNW